MNDIFDLLSNLDVIPFSNALNICDVNSKRNEIPLLHYVVRNVGPIHLKNLLKQKVDVNALAFANTPQAATALQWITGMMYSENYMFGHQLNYESHKGQLMQVGKNTKILDTFVGSADKIMHKIAKALIQKGATLDFFSLCALGNMKKIQELVQQNPSLVNQIGPDGCTPLTWAARRNQKQVVTYLLQHGADINHINANGYTAFEEAIHFHGSTKLLKFFLQNDVFVRKGIIGHCVEGHHSKFHIEKFDYLLSHCKNPETLITAADLSQLSSKTYYEDYLKIIAKHSISLKQLDKELYDSGKTPIIHEGCIKNSTSVIRICIKLGADINAILPNRDNETISNLYRDKIPLVMLNFKRLWTTQTMIQRSYYSKQDINKENNEFLKNMAILFAHGSSVQPIHDIQPHPINSLLREDTMQFMKSLADEFKNEPALVKQLPEESSKCLQDKIYAIKNSPAFAGLDKDAVQPIFYLDSLLNPQEKLGNEVKVSSLPNFWCAKHTLLGLDDLSTKCEQTSSHRAK